MNPSLAMYNAVDGHLTDAKTQSYGFLRYAASGIDSTNFTNSRVGELGTSLFLATACASRFCAAPVATFNIPIACVICICTYPEMSGIATRWIIARMANTSSIPSFTFRDWTVSDHPSYTVSLSHFSSHASIAIAFIALRPHPRPASLGASQLIDIAPKSGNLLFSKLDGRVCAIYAFNSFIHIHSMSGVREPLLPASRTAFRILGRNHHHAN